MRPLHMLRKDAGMSCDGPPSLRNPKAGALHAAPLCVAMSNACVAASCRIATIVAATAAATVRTVLYCSTVLYCMYTLYVVVLLLHVHVRTCVCVDT